MSVRDVYEPKPVNPSDPKAAKEKPQTDSEYWDERAKTERAKREYEEEAAMRTKTKEAAINPPEPPFQFKGSVNLGDIDMQKQAQEQKEVAEAERARKDAEVKEERQKREAAENEQHKTELAMVQQTMAQKMDSLEKTITQSTANQKTITQQINEIQELASVLGFQKPDPALPGSGDINMRIELVKLQNDNSRAEREFRKEMRREDREFQRQLRKDDDDKHFQQAELDRQAKRDEMFAKAPEMIGRAIASGLTEGGGKGAGKKPQSYHIEVAAGEGGETECPYCGSAMAIGPTARTATCPNPDCGAKMSIKRIEAEESGERDRRNS